MRRTESGRSVKTLPEYSKEAGDEELVLVRYVIRDTPLNTYARASLTYQEKKWFDVRRRI